MVLVDSDTAGQLASVDVDDEAGAALAASHLLELGHRDIAILAIEGPRDTRHGASSVVGRRLRGYQTRLGAAGIDVPADDVVVGAASIEGGRSAFRRLWASGRRPTGVLAMSDAMAIGVIAELNDLAIAIPGAVSVVGFDDIELAGSTNPPLTTVHQPVRGKGETAGRLLLSVIEGRDASPGHRRLETRLVVRSSTGPVAVARREVTAG
jgi:LacI family transcriptional regulator